MIKKISNINNKTLPTLRTRKTENKYRKHREKMDLNKCPLCNKKSIKIFKYWKIMKNDFPYDRIAKIHDLLVPKRHEIEDKLTRKELEELKSIKDNYVNGKNMHKYNFIMEVAKLEKTIPSHFHLHLLGLK